MLLPQSENNNLNTTQSVAAPTQNNNDQRRVRAYDEHRDARNANSISKSSLGIPVHPHSIIHSNGSTRTRMILQPQQPQQYHPQYHGGVYKKLCEGNYYKASNNYYGVAQQPGLSVHPRNINGAPSQFQHTYQSGAFNVPPPRPPLARPPPLTVPLPQPPSSMDSVLVTIPNHNRYHGGVYKNLCDGNYSASNSYGVTGQSGLSVNPLNINGAPSQFQHTYQSGGFDVAPSQPSPSQLPPLLPPPLSPQPPLPPSSTASNHYNSLSTIPDHDCNVDEFDADATFEDKECDELSKIFTYSNDHNNNNNNACSNASSSRMKDELPSLQITKAPSPSLPLLPLQVTETPEPPPPLSPSPLLPQPQATADSDLKGLNSILLETDQWGGPCNDDNYGDLFSDLIDDDFFDDLPEL
ncbi:hypothetical protein PIB30_085717 [Stylosanthes scabra]|uniref:Uncharacterized protein n=1 Tax=Stylosanthes scabra TaxID=79078 RepID=A0ABU6TSG0_9FABA|nr:hypothetical protein [Stylosanthes scabra]